MDYASIVIGLAGLAAAWLAIRHARRLETQLDALYDRYFVLSNRMSEMDEETQAKLAELRVEMRRQAGQLKFEPRMTIQQASDMHPRAADVLAGFHLGGCASCAVSPDQTLSEAAHQHHINLDGLMGALGALADRPRNEPASPPRFQPDPDLPIIA